MPPRLQCHGKEGNQAACGLHAVSSSMPQMKDGKQGGMWAPCRLVFNASGKSGNEAACELHTTSSLIPREGETRRHVVSMPSRCRCRKEGKQRGGVGFARLRWVLDSSLVPVVPPRSPSLTTGCWVGRY